MPANQCLHVGAGVYFIAKLIRGEINANTGF